MHIDAETPIENATGDPKWIVSVAFWCALFVAIGIYAAVALAPKFERLLTLKRDRAANQWRLVALEDRVQELDRVAAALQTDPTFAAELARSRFGVSSRRDGSIRVSEELRISAGAPPAAVKVELPWYFGVVQRFARNGALRTSCLCVSGVLVLMGFGFLHAGYAEHVQRTFRRAVGVAQAVGQRYGVDQHSESL